MNKYDQDGLHCWAPERKFGGGWKCFKSSPKAPAAPDPMQTANAQTSSNIATANAQAALNRNNQVTPWGSQTWTEGPKNADGTSSWTSTISLDPSQQKLLDSSNQISQMLAGLGIQQAGNVGNALSRPIDYNSLPKVTEGLATGVNTQGIPAFQTSANYGNIQNSVAGGGPIQNSLGRQAPITGQITTAGNIQRGVDAGGTENLTRGVGAGGIQRQVDMSGVDRLVGGDALAKAMQDNQGAAYRQQTAYLDSRYGQQQKDLENKLIQQGVMQNSDAWNRAMNNLGEQRTFDYNNAYNNSFSTGLAANNQLYNQGLSTNQNQYYQALNNGQFANAAQAQGFGQALANAQLNNAASGQLSGQRLAQMQAGNAAQAQQYGQNANDAAFANAAQGQQFNQGLASGQFNNAAQAQQFGQNLAQGQFANQAQAQGYGQAANNAALNNAAAAGMFGQNLASAQLTNQAAGQNFNQTSQARAQALQELLQQQQNPINILNALRSGSQVSAPQFGNTPQGTVAPTDVASLYNNQYQGQLAGYNGQVAQNNALLGAGTQLGAAWLLSDRRMKRNIERIGTHPAGVGLYSYEYLWGEPGIGVMADEIQKVRPDAVAEGPNGFLMVNYGVL